LGDKEKRTQYDRLGSNFDFNNSGQGASGFGGFGGFGNRGANVNWEDFMGNFGDLEDILKCLEVVLAGDLMQIELKMLT